MLAIQSRLHLLMLFTLFSLTFSLATLSADTWTDASGKFEVQAEFVKLEDGRVQLKLDKTGKLIWVELSKLSEKDRQKAERMANEMAAPSSSKASEPSSSGGTTTNAGPEGMKLSASLHRDPTFPERRDALFRIAAAGGAAKEAFLFGNVRIDRFDDSLGRRIPVDQFGMILFNIGKQMVPVDRNSRDITHPKDGLAFGLAIDPDVLPNEIAIASGEFSLATGGTKSTVKVTNLRDMIGKRVDSPELTRIGARINVQKTQESGRQGIQFKLSGKLNAITKFEIADSNRQKLSGNQASSTTRTKGIVTARYFFQNDDIPEDATLFVDIIEDVTLVKVPFEFKNIPITSREAVGTFAGDGIMPTSDSNPKVIDVKIDGTIQNMPERVNWAVRIDAPSEPEKFTMGTTAEIRTILTKTVFNKAEPIRIGRSRKFAVCAIANSMSDMTAVSVVDLANLKTVTTTMLPHGGSSMTSPEVMDFEMDRQELLLLKDRSGADQGRLEFRNIEEPANEPVIWNTAKFGEFDGFQPTYAKFAKGGKLLTLGKHLILWDIDSAKPQYAYKLKRSTRFDENKVEVSPSGNLLAFSDSQSIFFVNIVNGDVLGQIDERVLSIAFSPDGKRLAGRSSNGEVFVWDLEANQKLTTFSGARGRAGLAWAGNQHLLVASSQLFDIANRVCVWEYKSSPSDAVAAVGNGQFVVVKNNELKLIELPHQDFAAKLNDLGGEDLKVIQSDASFRIDADLPFANDINEITINTLEASLKKMGYSISDDADLVIQCRVEKLKTETADLRSFHGLGPKVGSITYTPHRSSLRILKGDQTVLLRTRYHGPGFELFPKRDESIQQYVDRISKPDPSFFYKPSIPKNMYSLPGGRPLGESTFWEIGN